MREHLPTNEQERLVAGLGHVAVLFSALGLAANIALLLYYRQRSAFVSRHLRQALALQVLSVLVFWVIGLYIFLSGFGWGLSPLRGRFFAHALGAGILMLLVGTAKLVLAVLGALHGFSGQEYRQPLIGEWIDQIGR